MDGIAVYKSALLKISDMHRFFIAPESISDNSALLSGPEARHLQAVLRLKPQEIITLFDGKGSSYLARIEHISKQNVQCNILSSHFDEDNGPTLYLGQALLTGQKMDLICQKTTELGITGIHPFTCTRTTVNAQSKNRIVRWQRITLEACKQSGRPTPPDIASPVGLDSLLARTEGNTAKLIFYEKETQAGNIKDVVDSLKNNPAHSSWLFLIGPEGGFTPEEINGAIQAGFIPISLGKKILRAETAAIAATAILQMLLGNLR